MRLLLLLTALMLAVAGGIWWKTSRAGAGDPDLPLQTDPNLGIATFGADPAAPAAPPASSPSASTPPAATGGGQAPASATDAALRNPRERDAAGVPKEPQTAATELAQPANAALTSGTAPATHVVKGGETLYRIVLNAYGTAPKELVEEVARANGMKDASALKVGQVVRLPSVAGWAAPKARP